MKEIYKRRSYHSGFDNIKKVSDKDVTQILKAAMNAPTAHNKQSWEFVVVDEQEKLNELADLTEWTGACATASHVVLICDNPSKYTEIDAGIAGQNITLAATSLDIGSLMMGIHSSNTAQTKIRELVDLPDDYYAVLMIALGYPTETLPPNDYFFESKIHYNKFRFN